MSERKSLSGGDWLAIGACFAGMLVAVLMAFGMWTGSGGGEGTAALAARIAGAVGPWPAMLGGAGIAFLGARAFLTGERAGLLGSVLGVLGVAAGLSVVAGSMAADRGGALGALTGGRVAELTHAAVGVLLGAVVAFGAAYFAWMREDPAAAAKLAPARRLTPAPPKTSDDGVTAAESAMLFPTEHVAQATAPRPVPPPAQPVKPLYPEDVRKKGEIPAGTRPLGATSALAAGAPIAEPAVYRWTAPRAAPAPDRTRIAPEEIEALADVAPPIPAPRADESVEVVRVDALAEVVVEPEEVLEEPEARPMPPRPTWETTGLTEEDEPVDAYGTPLSLVEKARRAAGEEPVEPAAATRIPREIDAPVEDEVFERDEMLAAALDGQPDSSVLDSDAVDGGEVEDLTATVEIVELSATDVRIEVVESPATPAHALQHDPVRADERPASLLEELRASNAALRAEAEAQDAYDVLEEEIAALEGTPDAVAELEDLLAAEEAPERLELEEEESDEVAGEAELDEAIERAEVEAALDDLEAEIAAEAPEVEPQRELEPAAPASPPPRAKPAAPNLFDSVGKGLFDSVVEEREVVLEPQAAVPASRAEKTPGRGLDPEKKLLAEVGCMFVENGRVAVSMLQRKYGMDFDAACRVLDDLQEMGLIGPYMGGKSRDILLSKDEWLEKVGA